MPPVHEAYIIRVLLDIVPDARRITRFDSDEVGIVVVVVVVVGLIT